MFISISFAGGQTEFLTASEPLGVSVSLTAMSMLMAETNDAEALQKYAATVEADMTQIFSCMLNAESLTEEQMQEGVASTGTLMGYPACLGYRVDMSEESGFQYEVEYVLAPQGTTF